MSEGPRLVDVVLISGTRLNERRVALRNAFGDQHVLFGTTKLNGTAKRERVEHELHELPFDEWCERYGVTPAWCRGEPDAVERASDTRSLKRKVAFVCIIATVVVGVPGLLAQLSQGGVQAFVFAGFWIVSMAVAYPLIAWAMRRTLYSPRI